MALTCYPCPVAKFERVPDHGPVGDWEEGLGVLIWVGREGWKRAARATQDQGLEPGGRDADCVGHRKLTTGTFAPQSTNLGWFLTNWRLEDGLIVCAGCKG